MKGNTSPLGGPHKPRQIHDFKPLIFCIPQFPLPRINIGKTSKQKQTLPPNPIPNQKEFPITATEFFAAGRGFETLHENRPH